VLKYLLQKGANPNVNALLASACMQQPKRMDVIRVLIANGAIYEQKWEYIDRETKQHVSKIVRFNDATKEYPDRLI
jgi:hypothetical protein